MTDAEKLRQAEAVRAACLEAAIKAYEQASISGLCGEGAWEVARGANQTLGENRVKSCIETLPLPPSNYPAGKIKGDNRVT